jgi:RNA polymerase sigma-70 factor (ECF subfamily)
MHGEMPRTQAAVAIHPGLRVENPMRQRHVHETTVMTATPPSRFELQVDELLVARAKRGEHAALEAIYRAFEGSVYTLARRMCHTPHDAEDVVQETFLEVVRSIPRFRGEGSFAGWVRRIAASKALQKLRWESARPLADVSADELDEAPEYVARGHEASVNAPARVDLEAALARLSDTTRAVIWLHEVEGYSHDEIAALTGMTASFSKSQLARAYARLRVFLSAPAREEPCT